MAAAFCFLPSAFCLLPSVLCLSPGILSTVLGLKGMVGPGGRLIWFVRPRPLRPTTHFALFGGEKTMKKTSMFLGVSIALLSLALTGCPERIRIGDISNNPGSYYDNEVTFAST